MFNPDYDIDHEFDYVGLEAPEWDPNIKYHRLNRVKPDTKEVYHWYYYTLNSHDMKYEVNPKYSNETLLEVFDFGPGYVEKAFTANDFIPPMC